MTLLGSAQSDYMKEEKPNFDYKFGLEGSITTEGDFSFGFDIPVIKGNDLTLTAHASYFVSGKNDFYIEGENRTLNIDQFGREYNRIEWTKTNYEFNSYLKLSSAIHLGSFQLGGGIILKTKTMQEHIAGRSQFVGSTSSFNKTETSTPERSFEYTIPYLRIGLNVQKGFVMAADIAYDRVNLGPTLQITYQFWINNNKEKRESRKAKRESKPKKEIHKTNPVYRIF